MTIQREQVTQKYLTAIVVDIYCRVSTDDQEENTSLDEQERAGRQFAKEHGFIVAMVHREVFSGYKYREREKLELMRQRYLDGKIQGVVIRTYDRLSRKEVHLGILIEEMEYNSIGLYCVKETLEDTLMGRLTRTLIGFMAEWEREKTIDRTQSGRIGKAKEGKVVAGYKAPYNWQWVLDDKGDRDYIRIVEEQASVTRWIADQYVNQGLSFRRIEAWLNTEIIEALNEKEMIKAPCGQAGKWNAKKIREILIDERLVGKGTQFNGRGGSGEDVKHFDTIALVEGTYPRILDDETYQKILLRTEANKQDGPRNCKDPEGFLLRAGHIKCTCGRSMSGSIVAKIGKNGGYDRYVYQCRSSDVCIGHQVPSRALDTIVWARLQELADHTDLIERAIALATSAKSLDSGSKAVNSALAKWKITASNYLDDLKDNSLTGDSRAAIRSLMNEANIMIAQYETEKTILMLNMVDKEREKQEYQKILDWCKLAKEAREVMPYGQRRDFLRLLGLAVVVEKKNLHREDMAYRIEVGLPEIQALIPQSNVCIEERFY